MPSAFMHFNLLRYMLYNIPPRTPVLVNDQMLPRYWPAVWALLHGGGLADSTLRRKLTHIEALYKHVEEAGGELDDILSALDFDALSNALESFFSMLRNTPESSSQATARWRTAFHFSRDTCERIARNPATARRMDEVREKISRLDKLYLGLRPRKKKISAQIRALPRNVVSELLDAATPESKSNPFSRSGTQWRVYGLVVLLLMQGLRRGEALTLKANSLVCQKDLRTGNHKWLLRVQTNNQDEDPRANAPSIKTVDSIRTLPVTELTASIIQNYLENYRGKVNHAYLLSSSRAEPLSIEGANKIFKTLTEALSPSARSELTSITGARNITPHALRHTCAVLRMKQLIAMGNSPEQAMSQLRSFFGWSKTSFMPLHYAKAALDERLNETWMDKLDERLNFLRSLP